MHHEVIHMNISQSKSGTTAKQDLGEKHLDIIEVQLSVEKASAVIDGFFSKMARNGMEIKRSRKINEPVWGWP
jgi:hypothetical protein